MKTSPRFNRAFARTAKHFRLTKKQRALALAYALDDYGRASKCYQAIARSLR